MSPADTSGTTTNSATGDREPGRRERNRVARHEELLAAATEIVAEGGIDQLTMQELAQRVDCAVGTIYTYFDSKSALLAGLQVNAIQQLLATYHEQTAHWDQYLEREAAAPDVAALARVLAFTRLFVAFPLVHPREFELLQRIISTPEQVVDTADGQAVQFASMALMNNARNLIDDAVAAGALSAGRPGTGATDDSVSRTLRMAGAINGGLLVSNVASNPDLVDAEVFNGQRLARMLSEDLMMGWGATAERLEESIRLLDRMERDGALLPNRSNAE
ncbi:MAG: TetR/AcrR family transcriptional regulator [Actinomycetes bacterium]